MLSIDVAWRPHAIKEAANYIAQRHGAVIEAHKRLKAIDPSFVYFQSWVAATYRELGDYPPALRECETAAKSLNGAPYGLSLTFLGMGREQEARDIMRRLDEHARVRYVPFVTRAIVHAAAGNRDEALAPLQQGIDRKENFIFALRALPEMAPLVKDPSALRIIDQYDPRR
jgi:tetratricopeptide (TPR) repeat protein